MQLNQRTCADDTSLRNSITEYKFILTIRFLVVGEVDGIPRVDIMSEVRNSLAPLVCEVGCKNMIRMAGG